MSTTETALTAHLVTEDRMFDDAPLKAASDGLREQFAIGHCTLQLELGDDAHPCAQEPSTVV